MKPSAVHTPAILLHTLRASAVPLGEAPPTRLVVMPWGVSESRVGRFVVDALTLANFAANQGRMRLDGRLALDFEHNTLEGTAAYKSSAEPRPVAAWGLCSVVEGVGIVFDDLQWTQEGLKAWEGKLYQDISPSPFREKSTGRVIALHSAALCRHGELEGLTLHAAASPRVAGYLAALSASLAPLPTASPLMKAALLKLLAALGVTLADTATDDEITATLNAAADSATKKASLEKEEEATGMSAKFNALSAEFDGFKKQALIDQATAAGKAIPLSAEELKITPLSVVKTLCDAAPAGSVPLSKESKTTETPTKAEPLSAECVKLAAAMGMSPEDVVKYSAQ